MYQVKISGAGTDWTYSIIELGINVIHVSGKTFTSRLKACRDAQREIAVIEYAHQTAR